LRVRDRIVTQWYVVPDTAYFCAEGDVNLPTNQRLGTMNDNAPVDNAVQTASKVDVSQETLMISGLSSRDV